nr:heavy metal tolerance protein [Quercus suber]
MFATSSTSILLSPLVDMAGTTNTIRALRALHYASPVITSIYFLGAKTTSACLLWKASSRAGKATRKYPALGILVLVALTALGQLAVYIVGAVRQKRSTPQDTSIYLVVTFLTYASLALGILETKKPKGHVYLSTCFVGMILELNCVALQTVAERPVDTSTTSTLALQTLRACLLLGLCVSGAALSLRDRVHDDVRDRGEVNEVEPLLHNDSDHGEQLRGRNTEALQSSAYGTNDGNNASTNNIDNDEEDVFISPDSDDPEKDRELERERLRRLKERGSWLAYLKDYKVFIPILWPAHNLYLQLCLAAVAGVLVAERVLNILIPRQFGIVVDELTSGAGTGGLAWRAIALWLLYSWLGSSSGVKLIRHFADIPVQQWSHQSISTAAFRHIMNLSMDFHTEKNSGELITAIQQGRELQELLEYLAFSMVPTLLDLVIAFFYVYTLFDLYMALTLFTVGVAYCWIGAKTTIWSIKQRRRYNAAWMFESKTQSEAINQWQTVSHFNRAEYECKRYGNTVTELNKAEWWFYVAYYSGNSTQSIVMFLGRIAASLLAAYRVSTGTNRVGDFVTLISYWSRIEEPLSSISMSFRRVSQMLTDSERLLQLLLTKSTVVDAPGAKAINITGGAVEFEHVKFSYDPRKTALKDISFSVKPGQTVALVGETGAGKSTVIKLLFRYYDIKAGAIRIDGQDIRDVTLNSLRDAFGMVPQDPSLFNASIMDNIRYARLDATDDEVMDACRAAAIHDKILTFPDKYKSKVGERGVKLSGGELQRIAIARGIVRNPKIVLLDEATSMIDAGTEALIQEAFKRLTSDRTTFIVAHRLSTIQHADLILVFNGQGEIVESGSHAELFRLKGRYVELWSKQINKEVQDVGKMLRTDENEERVVNQAQEQTDTSSETE